MISASCALLSARLHANDDSSAVTHDKVMKAA
jgi:hypothetical protein